MKEETIENTNSLLAQETSDFDLPEQDAIKKMVVKYILYICNNYNFSADRIEEIFGIKKTTLKKIKKEEYETIEFKAIKEKYAKNLLLPRFKRILSQEDRKTLRALVDQDFFTILQSDKNNATTKNLIHKKLIEYLEGCGEIDSVRACILMTKKGVATISRLSNDFRSEKGIDIAEDLSERGIASYDPLTESYYLNCNFNFTKSQSLEKRFIDDLAQNFFDPTQTDIHDLCVRYYIGFTTEEDFRVISRAHSLPLDKKKLLVEASEHKENATIPTVIFESVVSLGPKILKEEFSPHEKNKKLH